MARLPRIGSAVAACALLGACSQLIGLNQFDTEGEAGAGGSGVTAGKGGAGGQGGTATAGGSGGVSGGAGANDMAGSGGKVESGGGAGRPMLGPGGEGGAAGEPTTGSGGTGTHLGGSGGSAGAAGEPGCSSTTEIMITGAPSLDPELDYGYYSYEYNLDPQIGTAAADYLWLDFYFGGEYDGESTGTFELGSGAEENYASCSRCVWLGEDVGDSGDAKRYYFAKSGTLAIAADSDQGNGYPDLQLSDVLLTEVTLDSDTHVSTEVSGGRCLHLTSASLVMHRAPAGWTCADFAYGLDDGCDCGCGIPDPDCASNSVGVCEFCDDDGSCGYDCTDIALDDNSQCAVSNEGWTCDYRLYGDGASCDCGCGVKDVDCPSKDASDCASCGDPKSCTASGSGTCSDIDPSDNSQCQ